MTEHGNPPSGSNRLYEDWTLPIEQRVDDLVSRMTLEEKIFQMLFNAPPIERLDVPEYNWWSECLHGVGYAGLATVFPQAIGLAATWNTQLLNRVATVTSDEARAKHHDAVRNGFPNLARGLTFWSPNVNMFRDPRWGRGQETYGEDPYLTGQLGIAFVKGLQGDDPRYLKLVATPKHYAVHSGPEPKRHCFDARVDERDLRETYLPAFEACVKEGQAASVMGAYNRTNGEPCCASPTLLQKILREEWGFDGYVVSDCWAIRDIYTDHKLVANEAAAAAVAVKNGCDLNCGDAFVALTEAVPQGLVSEEEIDRAVRRLFLARFRLGMFDPPERVKYTQIPYEVNACPAHAALARKAAQESIVLLKNENRLLPLPKSVKSIAVIGPNADEPRVLLGNYNGTALRLTSPLEGIRRAVGSSTKVYQAVGCEIAEGMKPLTTVSASCLRPDSPDPQQLGLTAAYFDNLEFDGEPAFTRIDPVVQFYWPNTSPLGERTKSEFAVRWTGSLVPRITGRYDLGVTGLCRYTLYLDDELVVEYQGHGRALHLRGRTTSKEVELEAGRFYRIRLEYVNHLPDGEVHLVWHAPGVDYEAEALAVAEKSDVVVLVMGISAQLEGEEMDVNCEGFLGGDRTEIRLPMPQERLLQQIHSLGKPVVLVLMSGSALAIPWAAEHIPAIIQSWYPGQAGGDAIADVLFGDYNPAGRLPVTFYSSVEDLPGFEDYRMEGRTYRYFRGKPLYPFGYGLSFTTFAYRQLEISSSTIGPTDSLMVRAEVQNVGEREGDEVVQLYITDVEASVPVPIRQLAGFERVHLRPGETKQVSFVLAPRQLSLIDEQGRRTVEPGMFEISVGGRQPSDHELTASSANVLVGRFEVKGQPTPIAS